RRPCRVGRGGGLWVWKRCRSWCVRVLWLRARSGARLCGHGPRILFGSKKKCRSGKARTGMEKGDILSLPGESQLRRESENWAFSAVVQLSWLMVTRAQLTLDWVLRTSEVILISTRVGLTLT